MTNTGAMIGKQHQIRNSPVSITLANSPYTVPANISEVNVNTAGGNVRVNLPNSARKITVNKTSSDSYLVTLYVSGTQIGEIAGELSSVVVESGQITKDEPWYPYDAIVSIIGVSGDGGEVISKNKHGRKIASGVAGIDDVSVLNSAFGAGSTFIKRGSVSYTINDEIEIKYKTKGFRIDSDGATLIASAPLGANLDPIYGTGAPFTNQNVFVVYRCNNIIISNLIIDLNLVPGTNGIHVNGRDIWTDTYNNLIENVYIKNALPYPGGSNLAGNGFLMYGSFGNTYRNCYAYSNGVGFKHVAHPSQNRRSHENLLVACTADSSHNTYNSLLGIGFYVISDVGIRFSKCVARNNAAVGMWLGEHQINDYGVVVDSCSFIGNGTYSLIIPNSSGAGISIDTDRAHILNSLFSYNKNCGLYIGGHAVVIGNTFRNNGQDIGRTTYSRAGIGFSATAGNRGDCIIIGNTFIDDQASPTQLYGYYEAGTSTLNRLFCNQYYGLTTNIIGGVVSNDVGYINSGSSTGTGSEQTIAHGLAAIPTGCKAWIRYPISATVYAEKEIRMDATNIYPKVKTGLAYDWRVE